MADVTSSCGECGATYRGQLTICPNCRAEIAVDFPEIRAGQIIGGKYEILSQIGVGGMGEVFKARHVHLHAFRAIKVMRRSFLEDEVFRARFIREAQNATRVQHRNLAVLHDFDKLPDGTYYMVFEFIEGITVRQWARQHGTVPVRLALDVAVQVLAGLDAIHRVNLLHRDISADNIMITAESPSQPVAKIIDLGVAKVVSGEISDTRTQVGLFVGNPRYASPEQLGALPDGQELDARADLYCLGVVLYEMLAGVPPFISMTPQGYAAKHLTELPPPFEVTNSSLRLPPGVERVVMKALEKDRRKRWNSALEFADALSGYISEGVSRSVQMQLGGLRSGESAARAGDRSPAQEPDTPTVAGQTSVPGAAPEEAPGETLPGTVIGGHPDPSVIPGTVMGVALPPSAIPGTVVAPQHSSKDESAFEERPFVLPPFRDVSEVKPERGVAAERPLERVEAPGSEDRPAPRRGALWTVLVLGMLVAAAAGFLWFRQRAAPAAPVAASATVAEPAPTPAEPSEVVAVPGFIALNAFPWGEIDSIREVVSGQRVEFTDRVLTPARIEVAPGRYEISFSNPGFPDRIVRTVDVGSGQATTLMVQFADPATAPVPRFTGAAP